MGRPLLRVVGSRLVWMAACIIVSGVLAYLYEQVPFTGTPQFVVIVLFYAFLCAWPCLLVSALGRTLQYLQQGR
jgi:hypothetical protein